MRLKFIGIKIPEAMNEWLVRNAKMMQISKSHLIRNILNDRIKAIKKARLSEPD